MPEGRNREPKTKIESELKTKEETQDEGIDELETKFEIKIMEKSSQPWRSSKNTRNSLDKRSSPGWRNTRWDWRKPLKQSRLQRLSQEPRSRKAK